MQSTQENLIDFIEQQKKCESEKRQRNSITEDLLSQIETVAIENSMRTMERRNDRKHNLMVFGHWKDKCSYFDEVDVLRDVGVLCKVRGKVVLRVRLDGGGEVNIVLAQATKYKSRV